MKQPQDSVKEKVLAYIRQNRLVRSGEKVVAAVSGGPDSVCLLHILHNLQKELNIKLHVAHLNHQLRGAESDADAAYVAGLARRLKIPATIESADVKAFQKEHRLTLEEAAREVRYCFLAATAQKTGAASLFTGHTANDHAETILMHLIRGSGIKGLRGLRPKTNLKTHNGEINIIRPLLVLSREETAAYCKEHNLRPRTDSTNASLKPFRNKVRQKLLPALSKYNPQISEALLRTARTAAADLDFIEQAARLEYPQLAVADKESVILDKKSFLALHPALQCQILRDALDSLLGSLKDIESGHIEGLMDALKKPAGKIIGLPFGLNFYIDYDRYVLAADLSPLCPLPTLEKEFSLNIPGKTSASGWEITASYVPVASQHIEESGFTACFDAATAVKTLTVRRLLPGDRFQPLGMAAPKKLNRFMMDARIPQAWRKNVPLVCSGEAIIWVAGWRISDRYRVKPTTEKMLKIEFRKV